MMTRIITTIKGEHDGDIPPERHTMATRQLVSRQVLRANMTCRNPLASEEKCHSSTKCGQVDQQVDMADHGRHVRAES